MLMSNIEKTKDKSNLEIENEKLSSQISSLKIENSRIKK